MAVTLVQGAVRDLKRDISSISFRTCQHLVRISHHPDLVLLENGTRVQLLADTHFSGETLDVLALKCEGHRPIYLGPRMGWSCAFAAIAVAVASVVSYHEWLLLFPATVAIAQGYFLTRRARIFESFASQLAEPSNAYLG